MSARILNNKYAMLIGIATVIYLGYALIKKMPAYLALREEVNYTDEKMSETEEYKLKLEQESQLLNNQAYLEQQARLKLNYKKSGEHVVYVYHQNFAIATPVPETLSFWQKLVRYFK